MCVCTWRVIQAMCVFGRASKMVIAGKTAAVINNINDAFQSAGQSLVLLVTPVCLWKKANRNTATVWQLDRRHIRLSLTEMTPQTTRLTSVPTRKITTIQVFTQWFFFSPSFSVSLWSLLSLPSYTLTSPCSSVLLHAGSHSAVEVPRNLTELPAVQDVIMQHTGPGSHSDQQICPAGSIQSWKLQHTITFRALNTHQLHMTAH